MAPPVRKEKRGRKSKKMVEKEDSESSGFHSSDDSDTELQAAFLRGDIKPGLNVEILREPKELINDKSGMKSSLSILHLSMPWVERLDMNNEPAEESDLLRAETAGEVDVNDDFKRELTFYRQGQAAVVEALPRLKQLKIPTRRPEDYFAQMAKTDLHMKKIREKLMSKRMSMERQEKARKLRDLRKYGKKVQQEVLLNRQKQKKEMLDAVKKFRKGQKDKLDFLDDDEPSKKGAKNKKKDGKKADKSRGNKKREYKNEKYGHGGQKKRSKQNTSASAADVTSYSGKIHSNQSRMKGAKGGKGKGAAMKRPGKGRRQNIKNKKR